LQGRTAGRIRAAHSSNNTSREDMMATLTRRSTLIGLTAAAAAGNAGQAAASNQDPRPAPATEQPTILFVHGAEDDATAWYTVFWRFESNGYDPKRLFAMDFTNPIPARPQDYGKLHPGRSTWAEQLIELAARVAEVKRATGEEKLVLVTHSRGGNAVRSYIKNANGLANVSMAVLCASGCHGIVANDAPEYMLAESNGAGYFLRQLNHGPTEATEGVRFLTIRSDRNDKYFQPILAPDLPYAHGRADVPSNIGYDSPELTGATNIVLAGIDHKEAARSPLAFREIYRFIAGKDPERLDIVPETAPVLDGRVTGLAKNGFPTNLPLEGASVEIFAVSPTTGERQGGSAHRQTTGSDGRWGPFAASPSAYYEFVLTAPGYPVQHSYRMPFPRSSAILNLRPRSFAQADKGAAGSAITVVRRNGNLARDRDRVLIDGRVPPALGGSPPAENEVSLNLDADAARAVPVVVNDEQLAVRTWLAQDNHIVVAEFHY
jgi:pimeloyl-ACP methyl ester carboxylesterase